MDGLVDGWRTRAQRHNGLDCFLHAWAWAKFETTSDLTSELKEGRAGKRSLKWKERNETVTTPRTKTRIAIAIGSKMVPLAIGYSRKQNFLVQVERT